MLTACWFRLVQLSGNIGYQAVYPFGYFIAEFNYQSRITRLEEAHNGPPI
jgi:hypothetical protein